MSRSLRSLALAVALACCGAAPALAGPDSVQAGRGRPVTLVLRDVPVSEVFEMLSRTERINILLGQGVSGTVSLNLFEVSVDQAVRSIAEAAGYVAERRRDGYVVIDRSEAGRDSAHGNTTIRTFKVEYSEPSEVAEILTKYLSRYGDVTVLERRGLIVVEDLPEFVARVERLLAELDREPGQILIEARILEITLDDTETYGIDWSKAFTLDDGTGSFGVRALAAPTSPGFFFDVLTPNIEVMLDGLSEKGRVRTLSTPTLLALEDEEAEVVIGDRLGFRVTTTINEVTTESVEFLESGVILKFTASVDRLGRIVLEVHPEVSTGTISDGLPAQTTTEVTTKLITEHGQKIFIGGLMKDRVTRTRTGVPFLSDVPVLGWLFSRHERIEISTETVVVLTARLVGDDERRRGVERADRVLTVEEELAEGRRRIERSVETWHPLTRPAAPANLP